MPNGRTTSLYSQGVEIGRRGLQSCEEALAAVREMNDEELSKWLPGYRNGLWESFRNTAPSDFPEGT
jgi:hypothetical protein